MSDFDKVPKQDRVFAAEPSFRVPPTNVTVVAGGLAVLPCSIQHLTDGHMVAWTEPSGFVVSLNEKRVFEDTRMSVERPFKRSWNLHIREVRQSDAGMYICQINTEPVKKMEVMLYVQVPAIIADQNSSSDKEVSEGETVTLTCNASGVPPPDVSWFRITNPITRVRERIGSDGEILRIHNMSRDCGGTYECVADNGVGEKAIRRINIAVNFHPEVIMKTTRIGQVPGKETILECDAIAHPLNWFVWERDGVMLASDSSGKYKVEMFDSDQNPDQKTLSLRISNLQPADYGRYTCRASNFLGEDREIMSLYDYSSKQIRPTTTKEPEIVVTYRNKSTTPRNWQPNQSHSNEHVDQTSSVRRKYGKPEDPFASQGAIYGGNSQARSLFGPDQYMALLAVAFVTNCIGGNVL
ncbi:lachesin-like isoform X2 [Dreissena polymorpha]|uniref:lachesin-like isoform X2 n=1 Tax=Dreissena polymorpha TaxID=45954 RepID=UPI002264CD5C|nr:lachesin-like isoform X2 [Dreissena polymorpha]